MKLRAKVLHPDAAAEISNFYKQAGYQVTTVQEGKHHCVYSTIAPVSSKPSKPAKPGRNHTTTQKPLITKAEREILYWIVAITIGFLLLRML